MKKFVSITIALLSILIGNGQANFWQDIELEYPSGAHADLPPDGIFIITNDMLCRLCLTEISDMLTKDFPSHSLFLIIDIYTKPFERTLRINDISPLLPTNTEVVFLSQNSKSKITDKVNCKKCVQSPHLLLLSHKKKKIFPYNKLFSKGSLDKKIDSKIRRFFKD